MTREPKDKPKISVILPVYNEERNVLRIVERLQDVDWPADYEIVAIDDSSTDGSKDILEQLEAKSWIRVFKHEKNKGKGAAIRTALQNIQGEIVLIQDADTEYDPRDLPKLILPILECEADVVYGSRFKKSARQVHRTFHMFVNRFLTLLSNLMSGIYLSDMETCYKVFRTELLQSFNLRSNRFGFEVEVTAYLAKTTAQIMELPIRYYPRSYREGKKIGWRDGVAAVWHIVRYNLLTSKETCLKPKALVSKSDADNERHTA